VQVTSAPAVRALTNADVVTAELSATDNAVLDVIAAAVATEGDALGDGVLLQGDDGTDRTNVLVDTDGHLQVDVLANPSQAVTNTGTFATQATLAAETTKVIGTVNISASQTVTAAQATATSLNAAVVGAVAHDGSTAANPVGIAGHSLALGSATTDVNADGDVVNLLATRGGRLYVTTAHPNRVFGCVADHNTAQTNHSLIAATGSAATSLYITDIMISNGATAGDVKLLDGSGGTVLWQVYLAINGGCAIQLQTPIKLTANTALCFTSTSVTTHTVAASGFISAP
jgi:hypothetical protein